MKFRNKETGDIKDAELREDGIYLYCDVCKDWFRYELDVLGRFWEYYEEQSGYWYLDFDGDVICCIEPFDEETEEKRKSIGNYFDTEEEAEKAVEKLKFIKQMRDFNFNFDFDDLSEDQIHFLLTLAKNIIL